MKKIIELNGSKVEIDFESAKKIETYKIGDSVKVIVKKYGNNYSLCPGVITGFVSDGNDFNAIEVLLMKFDSYAQSGSMEVIFITDKPDGEYILAPLTTADTFVKYDTAIDLIERDIQKKVFELEQAKSRLKFIVEYYGKIVASNPDHYNNLKK
jgi:bifunctional DNA-binding transcriptional regulator/antitoxin component of YhaV-PrlF toxin-antitoxin module